MPHRLHVTFIDKEGDEHTFKVAQGDNLLDVAQNEDLEMEGTYPMPRFGVSSIDSEEQEHVGDHAHALLVT